MKNVLILSAVAVIGFTSCKKSDDKPEVYNVKYEVTCSKCLVTYTNEYGFPKIAEIAGKWSAEANPFGGKIAKLKVTEDAPANIVSSISVNGQELARKDGPAEYEVKVK